MRTVETALAVAVFGSAACDPWEKFWFPLEDDEAQDALVELIDRVNKAEDPGSYTYPCSGGGEIQVTLSIDREHEDSIVRVSGRWEIETGECGFETRHKDYVDRDPPVRNFTFYDGRFLFASEIVWEREMRRIETAAKGTFEWTRPDFPDDRVTCELAGLSEVLEAAFEDPFAGSLEGTLCESPVKISVSDFPGSDWRKRK